MKSNHEIKCVTWWKLKQVQTIFIVEIMVQFGSSFPASTFAAMHVSAFFFSFNRICWLFNHELCIRALFTDPQISLFNNFFIKNGSHDTIHTLKNYITIVFSIFNFNKINSIQTYPISQYLDGCMNIIWHLYYTSSSL